MAVRRPNNRGPGRVICKFFSLKMGGVIWCESQLERDYCYRLEYDDGCKAYYEQPLRLSYTHQGKKRVTTPDFLADRESGHILVEVKSSRKANKPEFQYLVASRRLESESIGADYEVITENEIRKQPYLKNIKRLYRYRLLKVPPAFEQAIFAKFNDADEIFISDMLNPALSVRMDTVYALLHQRKLQADLHQAVLPNTILTKGQL